MTCSRILARSALLVVALALASPAAAIPAFARKYATSCLTCHTVYPKLTPFGEAFRRNNFRFPGVDSDYIKAEQIPLGQEANKKAFPNAVYPASIPVAVPLSIGANGQALLIPSKTSSAGRALNDGAGGSGLTAQDLAAEAHLWAGAAIDDTITYWAELTLSADGVDVEHAQVYFSDLVGPKHAVNLAVGHAFPTLTQFGPHSSYLADAYFTTVPVADIYGTSSDPFTIADNYTGFEVNGVIEGRLEYSVGLNAGKTGGRTVTTDNFYGHVGYKIGGMRLDGEGSTGAQDPLHPWAEDALGVYAFAYQANSRLDGPAAASDVSNVFGLGLRGQRGSTELNVGWYLDAHNHGTDLGTKVTAQVLFAELSHVVYPWMVPAIRVERVSLKPEGSASVSDTHIMPGVAFAIRPNLKLVAVMNIEIADGFPSTGGWKGGSDWGPIQATVPPSGKTKLSEFESFGFFFAWAM